MSEDFYARASRRIAALESEVARLTQLIEGAEVSHCQQLDTVRMERDTFVAENARLNGLDAAQAATIRSLEAEQGRLTAALARVRHDLQRYGAHQGQCADRVWSEPCRCGLHAALAAPDQPAPEAQQQRHCTCRKQTEQQDVDTIIHYRMLAIRLGARPTDMLTEQDRALCESGLKPEPGFDPDGEAYAAVEAARKPNVP